MAVSGPFLRAYLEAQSELGTDEVILPYPLQRKIGAGKPGAVSDHPARTETVPIHSPGRSSGPGAGEAITNPPHAPDPAVEGLFASLEKSLADSGTAKRD